MDSDPPESGFSPGTDAPLLNVPQRHHFEVFLSMLQDALADVETLATSATGRTEALISYDDDLTPGFATMMQPLVASLRREIADLTRLLEIMPARRSRARLVRALLTSQIVRLDDSYAAKLRGYGPVDPRAGGKIDPMLNRIRADLAELLRVSRPNQASDQSSAGSDAQ